MKPKLALLGNAPLLHNLAINIDSCDLVIRCNEAKTLGRKTGYKTDILVVRNTGAPAIRIISERSIRKRPKFLELSEIWFARYVESHNDYSKLIIEANDLSDVKIRYFSKEMNERVSNQIGNYTDFSCIVPSTGILALCYIIEQPEFDKYDKYIIGFTFDMWQGHHAKAERLVIEALCATRDDLIFVPVTSFWRVKRLVKDSILFSFFKKVKVKVIRFLRL